jgi:hypothetical protein
VLAEGFLNSFLVSPLVFDGLKSGLPYNYRINYVQLSRQTAILITCDKHTKGVSNRDFIHSTIEVKGIKSIIALELS